MLPLPVPAPAPVPAGPETDRVPIEGKEEEGGSIPSGIVVEEETEGWAACERDLRMSLCPLLKLVLEGRRGGEVGGEVGGEEVVEAGRVDRGGARYAEEEVDEVVEEERSRR